MDTKICFVIMGFGLKTDYSTGNTMDLDQTYKYIIKPVAEECGYRCFRADEIKHSSIIDRSMYGLLLYADLVIADISTYNPNAIYELGVRHAVKPYHTIILKEREGNIPFDLSHTNIINYSYGCRDENLSIKETDRCKVELKQLIRSIQGNKIVDSPFYEYIKSVQQPEISEEELNTIITNMAEEDDALFALVEKAKSMRKDGNFEEAAKYWKSASKKMPSEPYYIQQLALCLYKSQKPSKMLALSNALVEINKLLSQEDSIKNDPETLGIAGAIYKNMYSETKDISTLDKAIEYYGDGFKIRKDYYNGENYALCLNIKASQVDNEDEKIYYNISAKKVRGEIIQILKPILETEKIEHRSDKKWIYATMANCYFATGDKKEASIYEDKFKACYDEEWELETYNKSKETLLENIGYKGENI